jgi:hypothetical protein
VGSRGKDGRVRKRDRKDARHLGVDHVPLTGIGHELNIPKIRIVLCED